MQHLQEAAKHMVVSSVIMPLGVSSLCITLVHLNSDPLTPTHCKGLTKKIHFCICHKRFVCLAAEFTLRAFLGSFSDRITHTNTKKVLSFHLISLHRRPVISNDYAAC